MKKIALIATTALLAFSTSAFAEKFNVDVKKSKVEWIGKKVAGPHNGYVTIKSGTLETKAKSLSGEFVIDLNTIVNEDLKDTTWNRKLVGHLKSPDFFDVAQFPTAQFKITSAKATSKNNYNIVGQLTIKGITKEIQFPAVVESSKGKISAKAAFNIDRTNWNIQYNSGKFFDPKALADKLIDDQIQFNLSLSN
jgi:polyisoprenoid-binding protein YceI